MSDRALRWYHLHRQLTRNPLLSIARHGPSHLTPDSVLDIAAFLERLRTHTANSSDAPKPVVDYKARHSSSPIQILTISDIQQSRVYQALRIISGSGTRWPLRLVEMCDELIKSWEMQFGPLADIRPLLYEKGGRLAGMHEERDLSRHVSFVPTPRFSRRRDLSDPS